MRWVFSAFLIAAAWAFTPSTALAGVGGPDSVYTGNANEYAPAGSFRPRIRHGHKAHRSVRDAGAYRWSKRQGGTQVAAIGSVGSFAGASIVARARADIGKSAGAMHLHRRNMWCATAVNRWTGGGTGSDLAKSYLHYGSRGTGAVGDIAVFNRGRRGGGHVGIVAGHCSGGIILISGNDGGRVRERCVSTASLIAYRRP